MRRRTTILALLALAGTSSACVLIEDGEVGVSKSFGAISDDIRVPQGVAFVVPVARQIETWNVKLQELKETRAGPLLRRSDRRPRRTSLLFQVTCPRRTRRRSARPSEPPAHVRGAAR